MQGIKCNKSGRGNNEKNYRDKYTRRKSMALSKKRLKIQKPNNGMNNLMLVINI